MYAMKNTLVIFCLPLSVVGWLTCKYDDWTLHGGVCYKAVVNQTFGESFVKAEAICDKLKPKSFIVMPKSNDELEFVTNSFLYLTSFWVGLSLSTSTQTWSWVDGATVNNLSEFSVDMSAEFITAKDSSCVVMSNQSKGQWELVSCKITAGLVCQIKAYDEISVSNECKDTNSTKANKSSSFNIEDIKVIKTSLSSYVRSKSSAKDPRMSSQLLGCTGVLMISLVIGFIVALDMMPPNRFLWNSKVARRFRKTLIRRMYAIRQRLHHHL